MDQRGEPFHRPGVVLVAERAEEAFPEGPVPADASGATGEIAGLALETDERRLADERVARVDGQLLQRRAATAEELFLPRLAFGLKPRQQFVPRRIEMGLHGQRRTPGFRGATGPDHMQDHVAEGRIRIVVMGLPSGRLKVDLDVAGQGPRAFHMDDGVAEIGAAFAAVETRMQDADAASVCEFEGVAQQALVMPDELEPLLRRRRNAVAVVQRIAGMAAAPLRIEAGGDGARSGHVVCFSGEPPESQAAGGLNTVAHPLSGTLLN